MYNFGVYHWRRHVRSLVAGTLALVAAGVIRGRTDRPLPRLVAGAVGVVALARLAGVGRKLIRPYPWSVGREKYDRLAELLPVGEADRVLDVGCGTGRSLVGLAPYLSGTARITALDVFDDRIVLGNTPARARSNARKAGLDAEALVGDATRLPVAADSQDLVVISRLLHDLPEPDAVETLAEARRVLAPDGHLGVLELPIVPDGVDPDTYWRDLLADAGFEIREGDRLPWKDDRQYVLLAASPGPERGGTPTRGRSER